MKKKLLLITTVLLMALGSYAQGVVDISIVKTGTATDEDDPTITFDASSDDAEQENDEIDALFDDDIDAGWEGEEGDANILTAGLRFQNVAIPQGATIDSAFFVVVSHEAKAAEDVARLTVTAEATDDAQTFTEDALITDRPRTSASVAWTVDEEWGLWTTEKSADVAPVVQEIVNRSGWTSGNSIAFIVEGEDQGPSEVENAREWQSFENIADPEDGGDGRNYPERAPRLVVYYDGYDGEPVVYDRGINSFAQDALDLYIIKTGTATDEDDPAITFDASSDDAEQENDAIDALFDDDIDAGWEGEEGDANILTAGLRFQRVGIPQGSTIDSAFIVVVSHEAKAAEDVAMLTVTAEATDDAETFTEDALITARPRTSASVAWTVDEEWGLWTTEKSVDISPVIQEIVNRQGWVSGNDIALIIEGEDQGPSEVENAREWQSFENIADPEDGGDGRNYPQRAPRLVVYYGGYDGEPIQYDLGINSFADGGGNGDVTSVDSKAIENNSLVYPNPTSGLINLILPSKSPATISLIRVNGGVIRTFSNNGLQEIKMNLSWLGSGMYIISVEQDGESFKRQVIVE